MVILEPNHFNYIVQTIKTKRKISFVVSNSARIVGAMHPGPLFVPDRIPPHVVEVTFVSIFIVPVATENPKVTLLIDPRGAVFPGANSGCLYH